MTLSDLALEQSARHQVLVQRFANHLSKEYDATQRRINDIVNAFLVTLPDYELYQLESQLQLLSNRTEQEYSVYFDSALRELEQFAESEVEWEQNQVEELTGSDFVAPAIAGVWAAILSTPMVLEGSNQVILVVDYIEQAKSAQSKKIVDIIRTGAYTNQSVNDIRKQLTSKGGLMLGKDKLANRRSIVTLVNYISNQARYQTMQTGGAVGYEWVSVLDDRTSQICLKLNGRVFYFDEEYNPLPPAHPFCRSGISPIFDRSEGAGNLSGGFSWLKRQSAKFQDDLLGPTRGKLLRNGGLTAEEFANLTVDDVFRPLTLEQMRERNPMAFEKANLN